MTKKTILYLNLTEKTFEVKVHSDLCEYLGGVGLGLKLAVDLKEQGLGDVLVLSLGPLSDSFPGGDRLFALDNFQKACFDGPFARFLRRAGFDGIVVLGKSGGPCYAAIEGDKIRFGDASFLKGTHGEEAERWFEENEGPDCAILVGGGPAFEKRNLTAIVVRGGEPAPPGKWEGGFEPLRFDNRQALLDCGVDADVPTAFAALAAAGCHHTHEELESLGERLRSLLKEGGNEKS